MAKSAKMNPHSVIRIRAMLDRMIVNPLMQMKNAAPTKGAIASAKTLRINATNGMLPTDSDGGANFFTEVWEAGDPQCGHI